MSHGFGHAAPIFRVASLDASITYYVNVLGFTVDWRGEGGLASVSRDECCLFLCEGDQGRSGSWAWVGVPDAGALFEELLSRRARIRHPPTNYRWAYEMQVEDLDGNVLRLGSDSLADRPFGEWLDMHKRRWIRSASGHWTEVLDG